MPAVALTFAADAHDPFVDYTRDLIAYATGLRLEPVPDSGGAVDVYYGNDERRPCGLRIPRVGRYDLASVPGLHDPAAARLAAGAGEVFPFDVFSAVRFWLADEGNADAPASAYDEHGRLRADRSAQEALGLREAPVVNAYLLHLRAWLEARLAVEGASPLPEGKRCVIVLSHDVDSPVDPGSPRHAIGAATARVRRAEKPLRSAAYAAGAIAYGLASRVRDPRARHRLFADVMDAEERRGFASTFFFAAVSRFDRQGVRRDVGYDVGRPPLVESLREVAGRGFGIGLHVSYQAGADGTRIAAERRRLEAVAGVPVVGSRHHYWHMTRPFWPSLEAHAQAGLRFDSSVAFNAAPGYRLGVALPFRPWNPETRAAVSVLQVPTLVMDSMLVSGRASVPVAVERFDRLLDGLKRYEGVAALDWHEYTSFPGSRRYATWGNSYLAVLDHLAADPAVLVQTYDSLVAAADEAAGER